MARRKRQTLLLIFLIIFTVSLIDQFVEAVQSGHWGPVLQLLMVLAILGFLAYRSREAFFSRREEYRMRFEQAQANPSVKDAALFSLAWSREIYRSIPEDRKQLVKTAFVLFGIALAVVWINVGLDSVLTVLIIAIIILAGVNLLVWVFSTERTEKDRLRIELDAARQLQLNLMPASDPDVPGFDISGVCTPAKDVGGDHYDYVWLGNDRKQFCIAVVDVAGKGMDAAMTAVFTSGAFVSEVQHETDIAEIMRKLNRAIRTRHNRSRFVSFFLLCIDVERRIARYVNAGQSKPLLLRDGAIAALETDGAHFPLGLVDSVQYCACEMQLQPGDRLLLFTDGLSEAMNAGKEIFGEDRLKTVFREQSGNGATARATVEHLHRAVLDFSQPAEQHDDLTIVLLHVKNNTQ